MANVELTSGEDTPITLPGHHQLPSHTLKVMGTLMHVHLLTNPHRVGRHFGVSAEYVRRQWRHCHPHELAPIEEALAVLQGDLSKQSVGSGEHR
jgi:hypothetical protein